MNCWLWLAFFFVFVVVPEIIKAFQVQNDYLCLLNPDEGISLAQRQRVQCQWVRTTKSVAGRIAHWKISRKVTMLLRAIAIMFLMALFLMLYAAFFAIMGFVSKCGQWLSILICLVCVCLFWSVHGIE
jgi:hypothetical protein